MSLVFYYAPKSTAVTVNWALEELGIPYEKVEIDLQARDQDKSGYRALNPNGKVPLVVHDGVPIFESAAIMIHLGETFGVERDLFPAAGLERAEALKWLVWTNVTFGAAAGRFLEAKGTKAEEGARTELEKLFAIVDSDLKEKTYLVGGTFSLVDVHVASFVRWISMFGFPTERWPAIHTWLRRCLSRPSHERSLAA